MYREVHSGSVWPKTYLLHLSLCKIGSFVNSFLGRRQDIQTEKALQNNTAVSEQSSNNLIDKDTCFIRMCFHILIPVFA